MRNRYPGICYRCNTLVEKGKGHFEKCRFSSGGWRVQHAECAIKNRQKQLAEARAELEAIRNFK